MKKKLVQKRISTSLKKILALVGLSLSLSVNAALYDRGNGLIYDDALDITWLQDANYAHTSGYTASNGNGGMSWDAAQAWIAQLNYDGYDDWRLPSANLMNATAPCTSYDGSCDAGWNNTTSELGHMFYNNLGNLGSKDSNGRDQSGHGVTNSSFIDSNTGASLSFSNLQNYYWFSERSSVYSWCAWALYTQGMVQVQCSEDFSGNFIWAVRDGDVSTVPIPAAAWLFGSALAGLGVVRRKK